MTKLQFDDIEIRSFRGIKQYTLNFDKKSLVFCGANGTGKSSFVNAIEYLFTGKVGSLSGMGDVDHDKSLIHMGDKASDVLVRAHIGDYTIERSFKNGLKYDKELKDLKDDFKNGSFILNRKKLLKFIESTPRKRYDTITNLISYEKYDKIEEKLRWVNNSLIKQVKNKKAELENNTNEIRSIYNCDIDDIYDEINFVLEKNNLDTITKDTFLKDFVKKFSENNKLIEGIDEDISNINDKYMKLLDDYENISLNEFKSANSLLSLLKKSGEYIQSEKVDECPICHGKIENEKLMADIKNRIMDIEARNNELNNWKYEVKSLINELKDLDYNLKEFDLRDFIKDLEDFSNFNKKISEMDKNMLPNIKVKIELIKEKQSTSNEELDDALEVIFKLIDREKIEGELEKIKKEAKIAEISYKTFTDMKKESIKHILEEISEYFDTFYRFIHGDDDIKNPGINVKSSNSLKLGVQFDKDYSDPRTFSSEGHIDTMGLCIFLAFVKRFNKYQFMMLDDIISTVDLEHKEQVIRLLFEEFGDYTFVITTHNKLWFEQLARITSAHKKGNDFKFVEIKKWDKKEGPKLSESMTTKQIIANYIDNGDSFAAGNSIRRYLEDVLYDICLTNAIRLPLKKHYTVDDYYKQLKLFKNELFKGNANFKDYYDNVFEELDSTAYMGNLLSHKNEANYDLSIGEIEKFKDAVYNFENAFKCYDHPTKCIKFNKDKKMGMCIQNKCNYIMYIKKQA